MCEYEKLFPVETVCCMGSRTNTCNTRYRLTVSLIMFLNKFFTVQHQLLERNLNNVLNNYKQTCT